MKFGFIQVSITLIATGFKRQEESQGRPLQVRIISSNYSVSVMHMAYCNSGFVLITGQSTHSSGYNLWHQPAVFLFRWWWFVWDTRIPKEERRRFTLSKGVILFILISLIPCISSPLDIHSIGLVLRSLSCPFSDFSQSCVYSLFMKVYYFPLSRLMGLTGGIAAWMLFLAYLN